MSGGQVLSHGRHCERNGDTRMTNSSNSSTRPPLIYSGVEKRQFGRRNTFLNGLIVVPGQAARPCIVRDLSVRGARLELPRSCDLPFSFRLVIEASQFSQVCEIRREINGIVGVEFVEVAPVVSSRRTSLADITRLAGVRGSVAGRPGAGPPLEAGALRSFSLDPRDRG
jgi:hypothetical protein